MIRPEIDGGVGSGRFTANAYDRNFKLFQI